MNNYYFILNYKEHVLIIAETEEMAKVAFEQLSLASKYRFIQNAKPNSKLIELIKQRKTN